jgi:hypothetical protein
MIISTRTTAITAGALAVAGLVVGGAIALVPAATSPTASPIDAISATPDQTTTTTTTTTATAVEPDAVGAMLLYMAEEEKLAQDVYDALGELWGARIFDQISSSEVTHQERVVTLLDAQGLADPRTGVAGVFTDPELQSLYDDLIALGLESRESAFQVGVMIEERDIADLTEAITLTEAKIFTDDPAVVTVLESLLSASQNHLAAFERQLS